MKLIDRLSTLLHADAHGVIDTVEDRALVLRQHVREAESALASKRARAEALAADGARLTDQATALGARIAALDADVELALGRGEEDLARFVIRKLLPARREHDAVERRRTAVAAEQSELDTQVVAQTAELQVLKARAREILTRKESDPVDAAVPAGIVADEEVELELLRRRGEASSQGNAEAPRAKAKRAAGGGS